MPSSPPPTRLVIFVLGPPGAGKTTLCTLIKQTYNFDHVAVGNELRALVKAPSASSHNLTEAEVSTIKQHIEQSEMVPEKIINKFLEYRILGGGDRVESIRVLVDGFPRSATQFKSFFKAMNGDGNGRPDSEDPDQDNIIEAYLLVIDCDPMVAQARVIGRGRDVRDSEEIFWKRVREYEKQKEEIMRVFSEVSVESVRVSSEENEGSRIEDVENMAKRAVVGLGLSLGLEGTPE